MKIETTPRTRAKNRPAVKLPIHAFRQCPYCDSAHLEAIGIHVFCNYCEWSSVAIYAELKAESNESLLDPIAPRESRIESQLEEFAENGNPYHSWKHAYLH
jgi:hypothetical protein